MPEPTGSGNADDQSQGGQGAGAGAGASGSGAGASGGQSQEQQSAQDQRLTAEAAKWRTQFRESEKQITTLKQELEELKKSASPGDQSELSTLKRTLADLQKSVQTERDLRTKAETDRRQEKLDNALLKAVGEAKLLNPDEATIVLRSKGRAKVADDGKAVFVITENGEEREVEITAASIAQFKLVSDRFFPADGAPGAGSKGGARGAAGNGLDFERGLKDLSYFNLHEKEMKEEMRRRAAG